MQAFWKERAVLCSLGMRAHKRACRRGGEPAGAEFCGGVLLGPVLQQSIYIYRTMNLGVEVHIRYNLIAPSVYLHSTPPLCFAPMALLLLHSFVAFSGGEAACLCWKAGRAGAVIFFPVVCSAPQTSLVHKCLNE